MERWLRPARVLWGLCGVLLMAALNRQDPMAYGAFLFLLVVCVLGHALPWLSLRATSLQLVGADDGVLEMREGEAGMLRLRLLRRARWPAFMVRVETHWRWAGKTTVLRHTVPVLRGGRTTELPHPILWPCRGLYELQALQLSSGFPLGLLESRVRLDRPGLQVRVLPRAQPMQWPLPWTVVEDPRGERVTRRPGPSFEPGMLRPYQQGEPVGRVSWRASARAGELVIQHYQQTGSVRLRLVVDLPWGTALADPHGAPEQAMRLAVGVCEAAWAQGVQVWAHMSADGAPLMERRAILQALAEALPHRRGLAHRLPRALQHARPGEQIALVVPATYPARTLAQMLQPVAQRGHTAVVCIAAGARDSIARQVERAQGEHLQTTLQAQGWATFMAQA